MRASQTYEVAPSTHTTMKPATVKVTRLPLQQEIAKAAMIFNDKSKKCIYLGNKANDTRKNNKPEEQMEWKVLLKKAETDSIKKANVPGLMEPSTQLFGTLACEITLSFSVGVPIWTNWTCITGARLAI